MDEELRNLQLDRLDKRGKSVEQLKKHSIDPSLENKPIDKALFLLAKGDDVQKLSVVQSLPDLVKIDSNAAISKILPKIQQELHHSTSEFHITTSQIFQILISKHRITESNITSTVLQGLEAKDPVVVNAWLETLLDVIGSLPLHIIQSEVLPMAVLKCQNLQSIVSRINCCKILGKICIHPNIKSLDIKKDILPTVYELCQDINYCVRAAICEQMPWIAQGLGSVLVKNLLLPNLVELSSDDNTNVRAKAISSVVNILPYLDKDTKVNTMVPLVMQLCQKSMKADDVEFVTFAKEIGLLVTSLEPCLSTSDAEQLFLFYQQICKKCTTEVQIYTIRNFDASHDIPCRQYCASNIPAMAAFTINLLPHKIEELCKLFKVFASDSCYMVRQTVAGIFYEVTKILGPNNVFVKDDFVRLLRDEAEEVLQLIIPQFNVVLSIYSSVDIISNQHSNTTTSDIKKALMKCYTQLKKSFNWRLLTCFLKQLEYLPMNFPCDSYYSEFMPLMMNCATHGRARPVRIQAGRTLLIFLRFNTNMIQRTWLRDHIIIELAESKCSYTRHVFIQTCINAIEIFSNKYFKENFFFALLKLASDKISTIRYSFVSLLPTLRGMLRLPQDRKLLQAFEQTILDLEKHEKDRDVLANLVRRGKEMIPKMGQRDLSLTEKQLIEEEENILKGKFIFDTLPKNKAAVPGRGGGTTNTTKSLTPPQKSVPAALNKSVPPNRTTTSKQSTKEIISDMSFLKQHFYIDAGVYLPMEEISTAESVSSIVKTENISNVPSDTKVIENLENVTLKNDYSIEDTLNITDDIKVNLRNLSRKKFDKNKRLSQSEIPMAINLNSVKNKRHSSVCYDTNVKAKTVDKRRSLNFGQKESSKIPVILKSVENVSQKCSSVDSESDSSESDISSKSEGAKCSKYTKTVFKKPVSSLPLPVRRKV